jgi:hypothetical protein
MVKAAEKSLNTRISGSSIWRQGAERQLTNLAAGFFNLRDSTSGKTAVKLSSNEYWSARMWFCWISASHNPASTQ